MTEQKLPTKPVPEIHIPIDKPNTSTLNNNANEKCASEESTTCLITPPNISIGHMYVYNITPDQVTASSPSVIESLKKGVLKFQSPAASSGPICRICHEGDIKEDLVSPCRCTGSVGLVHQSCMERWLSTRCAESDKCEICNYPFSTIRKPKSVVDWLKSEDIQGEHRRSMIGDLTCFLLLTPLAGVSSFLCVEGAKRQVIWGNSLEAGCLMALATFLFTIYTIWNLLTFRYHLKGYLKWRARNHTVKLIRIQRRSASFDGEPSGHGTQGRNGCAPNTVTLNIPEDRASERSPPVFSNVSGVMFYPNIDFGASQFMNQLSDLFETSV